MNTGQLDMQLWRLLMTAAEEKTREFLKIAVVDPDLDYQPVVQLYIQMAALTDILRTLPSATFQERRELDGRIHSLFLAATQDWNHGEILH